MLLTEKVEVSWNCGRNSNKKHYESLGYKFTKARDKFIVPVCDLMHTSSVKVDVKCDVCGVVFSRSWQNYLENHDEEFGDTCCKCVKKTKTKRTYIDKYGVEWVSQLDIVKEKTKQTMRDRYGADWFSQTSEWHDKYVETSLDKYGVEWVSQSSTCKERVKQTKLERYGDENYVNPNKAKQTCLDRYGVEHYSQTSEYRERAEQTSIELYGVKNYSQTNECKEKVKNTSLERYGVESWNKLPEVIAKSWETKKKNGSFNSSKPEQYLYGLLCGYYGYENVEWQKRIGKYSLDCELIINNIKIDVEYNGWYWHVERNGAKERDEERREYLLSIGYKQLNINSDRCNNYAGDIEQIINAIDILINTNRDSLDIDLYTQNR